MPKRRAAQPVRRKVGAVFFNVRNPLATKSVQDVAVELGGLSVTHTLGVLITNWVRTTELDKRRSTAEYGRLHAAAVAASHEAYSGRGRPRMINSDPALEETLLGAISEEARDSIGANGAENAENNANLAESPADGQASQASANPRMVG